MTHLPYPTTQWTAGESNPDCRFATPASSHWTSSPVSRPQREAVVPDGLEPSLPGCRPGVVAAGPRDHPTCSPVAEVGVEPTNIHLALDQAAFPVCLLGRDLLRTQGLHLANWGYEPLSSTNRPSAVLLAAERPQHPRKNPQPDHGAFSLPRPPALRQGGHTQEFTLGPTIGTTSPTRESKHACMSQPPRDTKRRRQNEPPLPTDELGSTIDELHSQAPPMGFEPTISTLTGWRALRATLRGRCQVPGVGIEPTASWFRARRCYQQHPPRKRGVREHSRVWTMDSRAGQQVRGEGLEPSLAGSKPAGLPISRSPSAQRKEWESNPQGSSLDRFRGGCRRLSAGPSVREVRTVGFEPTWSGTRNRWNNQAFRRPETERPAGVEPAHPPWQGGRQPLHHGRTWDQRRAVAALGWAKKGEPAGSRMDTRPRRSTRCEAGCHVAPRSDRGTATEPDRPCQPNANGACWVRSAGCRSLRYMTRYLHHQYAPT